MKKSFVSVFVGALVITLACFPGVTRTAAGEINVFTWADNFGNGTIAEFSALTNTRVHYDAMHSMEVMEHKLLTGGSGYDIVTLGEQIFPRLLSLDVFRPLDPNRIPNLANLDDNLMGVLRGLQPETVYGIVYQWGTAGIGMVPDRITALMPDAPLDSLSLMFDPEIVAKIAPCGVTMLDSAYAVIPMVLAYLGLDPNSEHPDDYAAVGRLLASIRPYIRAFVPASQLINTLATGETCATISFNGDVLQAAARAREAATGVDVRYVLPIEGVRFWMEIMAVPADAPNPEAAYALINHVLQPTVAADMTNSILFANAVSESRPLVDAGLREDAAVFPDVGGMDNLFISVPLPDRIERLRTRVWTRFQLGL